MSVCDSWCECSWCWKKSDAIDAAVAGGGSSSCVLSWLVDTDRTEGDLGWKLLEERLGVRVMGEGGAAALCNELADDFLRMTGEDTLRSESGCRGLVAFWRGVRRGDKAVALWLRVLEVLRSGLCGDAALGVVAPGVLAPGAPARSGACSCCM